MTSTSLLARQIFPEKYSEKVCEEMFINMIDNVLSISKSNNIMILTPWCDQGLGVQSRNYYRILSKNNFNVSIKFETSVQPDIK